MCSCNVSKNFFKKTLNEALKVNLKLQWNLQNAVGIFTKQESRLGLDLSYELCLLQFTKVRNGTTQAL